MILPSPRGLARLRIRLLASSSLAFASVCCAQTVFVSLGTKTNQPSIVSINPPGHGWTHSAAAPIEGTTWNRVRRPVGIDVTDPSIDSDGKPGAGSLGEFPLTDPAGFPLRDPAGQPTSARLNIALNTGTLATDKPRAEPAFHSKSKGAVPVGLMDTAWRVYLGENVLVFTLTGLKPGQAYDLYVYGAACDPGSLDNPGGEGSGGRFTLAAGNRTPARPGSVELTGGFSASLYTFDPASDKMALSPEGTTWARLSALADERGAIAFSTSRNSHRSQYVNGFQLVERHP